MYGKVLALGAAAVVAGGLGVMAVANAQDTAPVEQAPAEAGASASAQAAPASTEARPAAASMMLTITTGDARSGWRVSCPTAIRPDFAQRMVGRDVVTNIFEREKNSWIVSIIGKLDNDGEKLVFIAPDEEGKPEVKPVHGVDLLCKGPMTVEKRGSLDNAHDKVTMATVGFQGVGAALPPRAGALPGLPTPMAKPTGAPKPLPGNRPAAQAPVAGAAVAGAPAPSAQ